MRRAVFLIVVMAALALPGAASAATCQPTAAHPYPVILVHGTFANQALSWNALRPLLEADGFCVFSLDYGTNATAPMAQSGDTVAAFARQVLAQTGAAKVSFVGHSQGGSLSRYVAKDKGLLAQTDDIVGLAPSSHGTTSPFAGPAALLGCAACADQAAGSPFMQALNAPPEAPGPVSYTVVSTRYDEVVTPYESQALAGDTVTNVVLQDRCAGDHTEHVGIIYDPVALQWARNALLRPGPANPAFVPDCSGATTGTDPSLPGTVRNAAIAPHLELRGTAVRVARNGRIAVPVRCVAAEGKTCRGALVVRAGGRLAVVRPFSVKAGRAARLALRLGPRARRASSISISAPHALTRAYELRRS
jgi:pimeloyl-ACP methyl ester carboxylesterase